MQLCWDVFCMRGWFFRIRQKRSFYVVLRFLCLSVFLLILFRFYRCPIRTLFGVNCPGCGLTRAFLAALHLDFKRAFSLHPLFWLVGPEAAYCCVLYLFPNLPIRNRKAELIVGAVTVLLLIAVWIIRW